MPQRLSDVLLKKGLKEGTIMRLSDFLKEEAGNPVRILGDILKKEWDNMLLDLHDALLDHSGFILIMMVVFLPILVAFLAIPRKKQKMSKLLEHLKTSEGRKWLFYASLIAFGGFVWIFVQLLYHLFTHWGEDSLLF